MYISDNGWRAKIGVLLPSINTVVEQFFNRVAPEGVSFHAARMTLKAATAQAAREMGEAALEAAAQVADCGADAIAYCCTAGGFSRGSGYDKELAEKIKTRFGLPCITATASILKAFDTLGMKRVVSFGPYTLDVHELEVKYFEENGIEITHSKFMGITTLLGLAEPSPGEIYRLAKATWDERPDADGLFIGCLNFRAHDVIQALENYTGRPVVTSSQATLWAVLRLAGIRDSISGYGRLMLSPT